MTSTSTPASVGSGQAARRRRISTVGVPLLMAPQRMPQSPHYDARAHFWPPRAGRRTDAPDARRSFLPARPHPPHCWRLSAHSAARPGPLLSWAGAARAGALRAPLQRTRQGQGPQGVGAPPLPHPAGPGSSNRGARRTQQPRGRALALLQLQDSARGDPGPSSRRPSSPPRDGGARPRERHPDRASGIPGSTWGQRAGRCRRCRRLSISHNVAGVLVYVNYSVPEDYEEPEAARASGAGRGQDVVSHYYGCPGGGSRRRWGRPGRQRISYIIFSEPSSDRLPGRRRLPQAARAPGAACGADAVADIPLPFQRPADPVRRPTKTASRSRSAQAKTLDHHPVLPISYADALPLLSTISGPVAPPRSGAARAAGAPTTSRPGRRTSTSRSPRTRGSWPNHLRRAWPEGTSAELPEPVDHPRDRHDRSVDGTTNRSQDESPVPRRGEGGSSGWRSHGFRPRPAPSSTPSSTPRSQAPSGLQFRMGEAARARRAAREGHHLRRLRQRLAQLPRHRQSARPVDADEQGSHRNPSRAAGERQHRRAGSAPPDDLQAVRREEGGPLGRAPSTLAAEARARTPRPSSSACPSPR